MADDNTLMYHDTRTGYNAPMTAVGETQAEYLSEGPALTAALGEALGRLLAGGDVICLQGALGAGKTVLAQGIARGWGVTERVTSPTFTLMNEYERPSGVGRFYHLDCYRLSGAGEAWALGLDDVLDAAGVVVIEWPERIEAALPDWRLWVRLERTGEGQRHLTFLADGPRYAEVLAALVAQDLARVAGN